MIKVLVIATPRSGSSSLISNIDGHGSAIFGEILLPSFDQYFVNSLIASKHPFEFLLKVGWRPSTIPGVAAEPLTQYEQFDERFIGFKVMALHVIKYPLLSIRSIINCDYIIFIRPCSFIRQIKSLARINDGQDPHYYANGSQNSTPKQVKFRSYIRSFIIISANNILLFLFRQLLQLFYGERVITGAQSNLDALRRVVDET